MGLRENKSSRTRIKKDLYFLSIVLLLSVAIALTNFFVIEKKYLRIKLYLYNNKNNQFDFESRLIPKSKNKVDRIKDVVNELIYGPIEENHERLFSPDTLVQFVAISKKGIVYISFNWNLVKSLRENPFKIVDSIVTSIKKNIRHIKGVKILIDGVESISTFNGINLYKTFVGN